MIESTKVHQTSIENLNGEIDQLAAEIKAELARSRRLIAAREGNPPRTK